VLLNDGSTKNNKEPNNSVQKTLIDVQPSLLQDGDFAKRKHLRIGLKKELPPLLRRRRRRVGGGGGQAATQGPQPVVGKVQDPEMLYFLSLFFRFSLGTQKTTNR
jgi:hypothetical protein